MIDYKELYHRCYHDDRRLLKEYPSLFEESVNGSVVFSKGLVKHINDSPYIAYGERRLIQQMEEYHNIRKVESINELLEEP